MIYLLAAFYVLIATIVIFVIDCVTDRMYFETIYYERALATSLGFFVSIFIIVSMSIFVNQTLAPMLLE